MKKFTKTTLAIAAGFMLFQYAQADYTLQDVGTVNIYGNNDSSNNPSEGVFITSNAGYTGGAGQIPADQSFISLKTNGTAWIGSRGGSGTVTSAFVEVGSNRVFIDGGGAEITVDESVVINTGTSIGGTLGVSGATTTAGVTNTGGWTQTGQSTLVGATSINATGAATSNIGTGGGATNIGSAASINTILGATNVTGTTTINASGGANTSIGTLNGTSINTLQGAANNIAATGNNTLTSTAGANAISAQTGNSITTTTGNNIITATAGANNITAATVNSIQGPINNIGTSSSSANTMGNALSTTTVTARAGNATQALANGSANTTVTGGQSALTARLNTANVPTTEQVLLSNTAGTTVDARGKILGAGAAGYVDPQASTAAFTLTNGYGNTHGLVVTESQATLSGGTQSTSLTLNDRGASFSNAQTGAPTTVTGVANGRADFDAVNVRQFSGAIAAVSAQANIPALSADQDRNIGVGIGNFMGQSALAMGMHLRGSGNSVYKLTISSGLNSGGNDAIVGAGAAWSF